MHTMTAHPCKHGDDGSCTVVVTVTSSGNGCTVKVNKDTLDVERGGQERDLIWTLATEDYAFAAPGVVFGEVPKLKLKSATPRAVRWTDTPNDGKKYAYTVLVVKPDPTSEHEYVKCTPLDPWIHNN
jgi:hypothetical protein